jgi:hypothetical protein
MIYAGIGSRTAPPSILELMILASQRLGLKGWTVRSGRAIGADQAFEHGCDSVKGKKEIFLPWPGFPKEYDYSQPWLFGIIQERPTPEATVIVRHLLGQEHWARLSDGGRKLQSRNAHQVLGANLKTPVDLLICWAPPVDNGQVKGGTNTAWRLAQEWNIPCYNLYHQKDTDIVYSMLYP